MNIFDQNILIVTFTLLACGMCLSTVYLLKGVSDELSRIADALEKKEKKEKNDQ